MNTHNAPLAQIRLPPLSPHTHTHIHMHFHHSTMHVKLVSNGQLRVGLEMGIFTSVFKYIHVDCNEWHI